MSDRDGPRATASYSRNWLILFATLALMGIASFLLELTLGAMITSAIIGLAIAAVSAFALADGAWRLIGYEGFLGPGAGLDRLLAVIQVLLASLALLRAFM